MNFSTFSRQLFMMRAAVQFILPSVMLASVFACGFKKQGQPLTGTTIGTLSGTEGYSNSKINYTVLGTTYKVPMINTPFLAIDGEKYLVHFDSADAGRHEIEFWRPLFEDDEPTTRTMGTITRGAYWYRPGLYAVEFVYRVGDSSFLRGQKLPPEYKDDSLKIKKGDRFPVRTLTGNAARAVMDVPWLLR